MKNLLKLNKVFFLLVGLALPLSSYAGELVTYLNSNNQINSKQQHYLDVIMESKFHINYHLAEINYIELNGNEIELTLPNGLKYSFRKDDSRSSGDHGKRKVWVGFVNETNWVAHFVWYDNYIDGHIAIDDIIYVIRDISDGISVVVEVDGTLEEDCSTVHELKTENEEKKHNLENEKTLPPNLYSTGECKVRVQVAYTPAVDASLTDVLASVINQVSIANTGYANSGVGFEIELAACFETNYTESGSSSTDLSRSQNNSDGFMDEVHTHRSLWSADQCALIITGGGGVAYYTNSSSFQFSVTGINNFSVYTFHHELGHNSLCSHSLTQASSPGTAPYSGWGEPTVGCFRTIMAYSDACGTGSCSRQNIFSDDNGTWSCSSVNYPKGDSNSRNTDRLVLSRPILVSHMTVGVNSSYSDDFTFLDKEAVHFAADQGVSYSSQSNNFDLQSGSVGSFRATETVTLGEGFWARDGSEFTAYLDDCTPLRNSNPDYADSKSEFNALKWTVQPNPTKGITSVSFDIQNDINASIAVYDLSGRNLITVTKNQFFVAGSHLLDIDLGNISPGTYLCEFRTDSTVDAKRIIRY